MALPTYTPGTPATTGGINETVGAIQRNRVHSMGTMVEPETSLRTGYRYMDVDWQHGRYLAFSWTAQPGALNTWDVDLYSIWEDLVTAQVYLLDPGLAHEPGSPSRRYLILNNGVPQQAGLTLQTWVCADAAWTHYKLEIDTNSIQREDGLITQLAGRRLTLRHNIQEAWTMLASYPQAASGLP